MEQEKRQSPEVLKPQAEIWILNDSEEDAKINKNLIERHTENVFPIAFKHFFTTEEVMKEILKRYELKTSQPDAVFVNGNLLNYLPIEQETDFSRGQDAVLALKTLFEEKKLKILLVANSLMEYNNRAMLHCGADLIFTIIATLTEINESLAIICTSIQERQKQRNNLANRIRRFLRR